MLRSDLRSLTRLATDATVGVSRVAEGVHQAVWSTLGVGPADGRTRGLTGFVYRQVRRVARLSGSGVDATLRLLPSSLEKEPAHREAWVAALNGVLGDRLETSGSPLATPMTLRHRGAVLPDTGPLDISDVTGRAGLFVHGLCLDERCWHGDASGVDYAAMLEGEGFTPLHLRYNTGLPIAENGRRLAALLDRVVARWPVPLERLDVIGHSMGGLVLRSALYAARTSGFGWPDRVRTAVFLGTPHHGAPLERIGHGVDRLLGATRFSAPFAQIGLVRSAGITDLRHGRVSDRPLPLPADTDCYAVAATLASAPGRLADASVGDGLVPLASALGQHTRPEYALTFAETRELRGAGHFDLLRHPDVARWLAQWLTAG
jgi:hypothetical protein